MTAQTNIEVVGVKEALATLNRIDKSTRRQITKDYQNIVQPLVSDAKQLVPKKAPLSGFDRSWTPQGSSSPVLPFSGATSRAPRKPTKREMNFPGGRRQMVSWMKWEAGIRAYVSGKRPQTIGGYTRNLSAFGVKWQGPAAVLFDTSGQSRSPQGARMVAALTGRYGRPSRVMWKAYQAADKDIQDNLEKLVQDIMRKAEYAVKHGKAV